MAEPVRDRGRELASRDTGLQVADLGGLVGLPAGFGAGRPPQRARHFTDDEGQGGRLARGLRSIPGEGHPPGRPLQVERGVRVRVHAEGHVVRRLQGDDAALLVSNDHGGLAGSRPVRTGVAVEDRGSEGEVGPLQGAAEAEQVHAQVVVQPGVVGEQHEADLELRIEADAGAETAGPPRVAHDAPVPVALLEPGQPDSSVVLPGAPHLPGRAQDPFEIGFRGSHVGLQEEQHVIQARPQAAGSPDRLRGMPVRHDLALAVALHHPLRHLALEGVAGPVHPEGLQDPLAEQLRVGGAGGPGQGVAQEPEAQVRVLALGARLPAELVALEEVVEHLDRVVGVRVRHVGRNVVVGEAGQAGVVGGQVQQGDGTVAAGRHRNAVGKVTGNRVVEGHLAPGHHVGQERAGEGLVDRSHLEDRAGPQRPGVRTGRARGENARGAVGLQEPEHDAGRCPVLDQVVEHDLDVRVVGEVSPGLLGGGGSGGGEEGEEGEERDGREEEDADAWRRGRHGGTFDGHGGALVKEARMTRAGAGINRRDEGRGRQLPGAERTPPSRH